MSVPSSVRSDCCVYKIDSTMVHKCHTCKRYISPTEGIKCTICFALFHALCLKLSPGHRVSNNWRCNGCRDAKLDNKAIPKSPSVQSLSEMRDQGTDKDTDQLTEASSSGLAEEIRRVIRAEMSSFREDLAKIFTTISDFNRRVDTIETRLLALEERFSADFDRSKVQSVADENVSGVIAQLQSQLNDREQDSYLNDVEISGIQESRGENLIHITCLIGQKLGVELSERDIVSAERSGPRQALLEGEGETRPRIFTVRFSRRALRDQLLRAARVRRGADTSGVIDGSPRRFYINERLSRVNRELFYKARSEGKRNCWRFVWTSRGRVYIRRDSNCMAHRIHSNADIKKFFSIVDG